LPHADHSPPADSATPASPSPQQATTLVACTLRRSRSEHTPNGISLRPVPYLMLVGLRYCAPKTAKICTKLHSFGCPTSAESFDRREGLLCRERYIDRLNRVFEGKHDQLDPMGSDQMARGHGPKPLPNPFHERA
jgi:hypothetical protein